MGRKEFKQNKSYGKLVFSSFATALGFVKFFV